MGRKRVWPPKIHHYQARDEARVTVYENGKRRVVTLGRYGSAEAQEAYAQLLRDHPGGEMVSAGPALTVNILAADYHRYAATRYARSRAYKTWMERIDRTLTVLRRLHGKLPAEEFGPRALREVRRAMLTGSWMDDAERAARRRRGKQIGWCRSHTNLCIGIIRRAWRWAVSEELVAPERLRALECVEDLRKGEEGAREGRGKIRPVADAIVDRTLDKMLRQPGDIVRLMRLTGARADEITQMRPAAIDTEGRDPTGKVWPGLWVFVPPHHKTEGEEAEVKVIFLGPQCQQIVRPYLDRPAEAWLFSPAEAMREYYLSRGWKLPNARSRRPTEQYTINTLECAIRRAARRAGVAHWCPHQLRHAAGTATGAAFTLDHAKAQLGHRSIQTTLRYAEKDQAKAAEVAARLG